MDNATWAKEIGMGTGVPEIAPSTCPRPMPERKARPQKDQALNCPRCHSTNTKFCYYNNYSLTQPRYFCKTCRRYWTEGGLLRNVPVGGGSRKNKRSTTSSSSSSSNSSNKPLDLNPPGLPQFSSQNPIKILEGRDLDLAFPANKQDFREAAQILELAKIDDNSSNQLSSSVSSTSSTSTPLSALELLRTRSSSRGLNSFIPPSISPDANMMHTSGLYFQIYKPNFLFSADGLSARRYWGGLHHAVQENSGRVMFPFGAVNKQISSTNQVDQDKVQGNPTGYWNGMLGGGSW